MFKVISKFPCSLCKNRIRNEVMTHQERFVEHQKKIEIEKLLEYKTLQRLQNHYKQSSENKNQLHSDILTTVSNDLRSKIGQSKTYLCSYPGSHY